MLVKLTNQALDYAWGSKDLIPDYFGIEATGKPMAEIWFGTHDGSPTKVSGLEISLHDLLSAQGRSDRLPFLLKILAAGAPLSIQAHPNPEQALAGFAKENAAGIEISAANRNYKDDRAKPEMIVALTKSGSPSKMASWIETGNFGARPPSGPIPAVPADPTLPAAAAAAAAASAPASKFLFVILASPPYCFLICSMASLICFCL